MDGLRLIGQKQKKFGIDAEKLGEAGQTALPDHWGDLKCLWP